MHNNNLIPSLTYLQQVIRTRLERQAKNGKLKELPKFTITEDDGTPFTRFVARRNMSREELIVLLMALVPNIYPHFYDALLGEVFPKGGNLPQFGGVKSGNHRGLIPTGETVLFVLAGDDIQRRFQMQRLFRSDHWFAAERILYLEDVKVGEPPMSGKLILDPDYIELFTTGAVSLPRLSATFPAEHITTQMEWSDVVLNHQTQSQLREIAVWIRQNDKLLYEWDMHRKIKPGYRVLFHGPPGTGKTLAAMLLGKDTQRPVFRIDLSKLTSKYIGETEKNLANLFDKARNKHWILFFDEADAIFGKRTNVRDAHDKFANQEVSYLLQRIETHPGLVILASNFKSNIDEAFMRRFNASIFFPLPKPEERLKLWQKAFPAPVRFAPDVSLDHLAHKYELTGAHIMNVVQDVCLKALDRDRTSISSEQLKRSITKELAKEGKIM